MNALDLWHECRLYAITLGRNGERLHYDGPPTAIERVLPKMKAHRDALFDCVIALDGALYADGPYLPWGPRLTPARLREWQRELLEVVDELAKLERWPDADYDHVAMCIERQPISTLRPDLAYFRGRLDTARTEEQQRTAKTPKQDGRSK